MPKRSAHSGIEVELKPTSGSTENLQLLRTGGADVAFVRGGSADPVADEEAGLTSLGSLFYEPIWLFYRADSAQKIDRKTGTLTTLAQLRGLRVNIDLPGSGLPDIMERLLKRQPGWAPNDLLLSNLEQASAAEALQARAFSMPSCCLPRRNRRRCNGCCVRTDIKLMDFEPGRRLLAPPARSSRR